MPCAKSGWPRVIALAPTADIGPVIDAVGAGVSGVLIGRRANPAAASLPSTIHDLSTREIEVIRLVADGTVEQVDRRAAVAVGTDREEPPGPDRPQARHR